MKNRQNLERLNKKTGENNINKFLHNPKKMIGAFGLATLGTAGIIGYNHYKNKKRQDK